MLCFHMRMGGLKSGKRGARFCPIPFLTVWFTVFVCFLLLLWIHVTLSPPKNPFFWNLMFCGLIFHVNPLWSLCSTGWDRWRPWKRTNISNPQTRVCTSSLYSNLRSGKLKFSHSVGGGAVHWLSYKICTHRDDSVPEKVLKQKSNAFSWFRYGRRNSVQQFLNAMSQIGRIDSSIFRKTPQCQKNRES